MISPIAQAVGARLSVDRQVMLQLKANASLRTILKQPMNDLRQITVLLEFSNLLSPVQINELKELGTLETFTGHVATMHLPVDNLAGIASLDFVSHVDYPRQLKGQLDVSVPEILANNVWENVRDPEGNSVNGTGVIVGVVDTGIDYTHRDFFFNNGTSKISYIWDQSMAGNSPQGFDYGNECDRTEIQASTCSEIDGNSDGSTYLGTPSGHGTAVASVATSTGQATRLFDSCINFDGEFWHNDTSQCRNSNDPFVLLADTSEYRYFGSTSKFSQIFFEVQSAGNYQNMVWEYSQGGGVWSPLDVQLNETLGFSRSGTVYFGPPGSWKTDIVDGSANQYWVRVKAVNVAKVATIDRVQTNPPYTGVAPGALVIAVKLKDATDAFVLDADNYIVKKAQELDLPYVINHSFGDSLGSHDGTEPLELAFADLASQGVPIVVSAGNSRNAQLHVTGALSPGQTVSVAWSNTEAQNFVDIWYPVTDSFGIFVTAPDGTVISGPTSESGVSTVDGNVLILSDARTTGREWWVNITSSQTPSQSQHWSFTLTALKVQDAGKWDAWTEPGQFLPNTGTPDAGSYRIDPSDTIDYPGNSPGVITVGQYMTKYFWWSGCDSCIDFTTTHGVRGIWWVTTQASGVGDIAVGSAMGPTRDGRIKPDIVAPGSNIAAARASNLLERYSDPDNFHQVFRGTSFAAPHVAGVVALMLQMNRFLSPNDIKTILIENARQDEFTGRIDKGTGSPLWGWGKVNALNSTLEATSRYTATVEIESLGLPITTNLTLDGRNILMLALNETRPVTLEFKAGANHTLTPSTIIQIDEGTRYRLVDEPWTFAAGGVKTFQYQLQYHLQVTSPYGLTSGTGWYKANSTAIVSVIPTITQGQQFQSWIGGVFQRGRQFH